MEPSLALRYELSSLVKLSGGVALVGVHPDLVVAGAVDGRMPLMYFFRLDRSLLPHCWSKGKLIGRSTTGGNDELP